MQCNNTLDGLLLQHLEDIYPFIVELEVVSSHQLVYKFNVLVYEFYVFVPLVHHYINFCTYFWSKLFRNKRADS